MEPRMLECINISFEYAFKMLKAKEDMGEVKTRNLKDHFISISSGIRIKKEYYSEEGGVKIICPGDIKDSNIKVKSLKQIHSNVPKEKDIVFYGDILITATGRSGQIAFVTKDLDGYAITSDIIRIRPSSETNRVQIFSFLKSELGQQQINSFKKGVTNKIFIEDIGSIKIPCDYKAEAKDMSTESEQHKINKRLKSAKKIFDQYVDYKGEENWEKVFHVNEKLLNLERWEPRFYSFYSSKLFTIIMRNTDRVKWENLGDLVIIKKAVLPELRAEDIVKYITISDVDAEHSRITSHQVGYYGSLSNRMRYIVQEGELLTARAGSTTGKGGHASTLVISEYKGMVASYAFYNLIPVNISPHYLLFLLRQPVILGQIDALVKGNLYRTIQREDFESIKIPRVCKIDEDAISELMKDTVR